MTPSPTGRGRLFASRAGPGGEEVTSVTQPGWLGGIEVDVDHAVERAHGHAHRLAQSRVIELAGAGQVLGDDDRAEVADRRLLRARVEGDLRAQVGGVDDTGVVLRAADVTGVLERHPRVAG